eukprot:932474_1
MQGSVGDLFGPSNKEYVNTPEISPVPPPGSERPGYFSSGPQPGQLPEDAPPFVRSCVREPQLGEMRRRILDVVYGARKRDFPTHWYGKVPGPLPVTLSRSHLHTLAECPFWVCEKSDGVRALLYVTKDAAFLIDRKFRLLNIESGFYHRELWISGDILLDGELLGGPDALEPDRWCFRAYDAVLVDGHNVSRSKLTERLVAIGKVVGRYRERQSAPHPFVVLGKAFTMKKDLPGLLEKITHKKPPSGAGEAEGTYVYTDRHGRQNYNDGLIFTPEDGGFLQEGKLLLKWKWAELNTVDFKVRAPYFTNTGFLRLYCGGPRNSDILVDRLGTRGIKEREKLVDQFKGQPECLVECAVRQEEDDMNWEIHRIRPDKGRANFVTTVISTLTTMVDNVTVHELVRACRPPVRGHPGGHTAGPPVGHRGGHPSGVPSGHTGGYQGNASGGHAINHDANYSSGRQSGLPNGYPSGQGDHSSSTTRHSQDSHSGSYQSNHGRPERSHDHSMAYSNQMPQNFQPAPMYARNGDTSQPTSSHSQSVSSHSQQPPSHSQSTHSQSTHSQSTHSQPTHSQSGHSQSSQPQYTPEHALQSPAKRQRIQSPSEHELVEQTSSGKFGAATDFSELPRFNSQTDGHESPTAIPETRQAGMDIFDSNPNSSDHSTSGAAHPPHYEEW